MIVAARIVSVGLCLALLGGCGEVESPPPEPAAPARVLHIGLIPEQNVFKQLARYEPLASYLAQHVGVEIELRILPRYGNIIDNFESEHLDGAFFGSFTYALAHSKLGVEVVARPQALDGRSTYHGLIFVRNDSAIESAADMKGKRFVFVDKATTAGYLLPLEFFHENGIGDYKSYLRETYFAGTHRDAIYDVLDGKADVGAAKNTVFDRLLSEDARIAQELIILQKSPDVPENGLALKSTLETSLKDRLRQVLLAMHDNPAGQQVLLQFGARRFIETTDKDYAVVFAYAAAAGLDLASYDYIND
jgi:phosphonate transport system substrate-binding protein